MANWATQSAIREYNVTPNGELTVVERLASLLETGQFADVEINVGTGSEAQTFKAHRILLATASEPLNTLLTSGEQNHAPGETVTLNVTDIDPESFHHILKYIYTDDVKISSVGEAIDLVKYAEKWGLEPLGKKTVKFMHQYLDEFEPTSEECKNDLCELLIFSEEEEDKLNMRCWEVLLRNVNEVIPCQSFLNMSEQTLEKMLTHHAFSYKNQLNLFEAIRDWGMNQVLAKQLPVTKLQSVIGRLLKHIKLDGLRDEEFMNTVLPSDCLDKSDLISYFMARGLEIPRDLAFNSSGVKSNLNRRGVSSDYEKATRFKKGIKIQGQEIYREHELRFRVDTNVILYGVAFGFLFSNVDMGITVHCQGPWETNQWSDIVKTYCRVSWETMKTADIRLMFSEPVKILANHSYKILVRIGRMSAGPSEVDLWGGGDGEASVQNQGAVFHFLKNAVHPNKKVEEKDIDNKPSMITKLIFEVEGKEKPQGLANLTIKEPTPSIDDVESPTQSVTSSIKSPATPIISPSSPIPFSPAGILPKPYSPCSSPVPKPFSPVRGPLTPGFPAVPSPSVSSYTSPAAPVSVPVSQPISASTNKDTPPQSPLQTRRLRIPETAPKKTYLTQLSKLPDPEPPWTKRRDSIKTTDDGQAPFSPFRTNRDVAETEQRSLPWQRKASLTKKEELPSFTLKPRSNTATYSRPLVSDRPKQSWEIPSRYKPSSTSYNIGSTSTREPSVSRTREPSISRTREYTPLSTRTDGSRYGTSRLGASYNFSTPSYSSYQNPGLSTSSRFGQVSKGPSDSSASAYKPLSSATNTSSPYSSTSRPYGQLSSATKASSPAPFSSNYSRNPSSFSSSRTSGQGPTEPSTSYSRYGKSSFDSPPSKFTSSLSSAKDSPSSSRFGSSYKYGGLGSDSGKDSGSSSTSKFSKPTSTYRPMSSVASRLTESKNFLKESSPYTPRTSRTSAYNSANSPFPSHVSSVKSRFSGNSSPSSSYYRR